MRKFILCFIFLSVSIIGSAQSIIPSVIKEDRAFARLSYDSGVTKAFEKYLHDGAEYLSISPLPIKGKADFLKMFENIRSIVIWQPTGGSESADGTLGYTYGISKWVYPVKDTLKASYYLYQTNWKKDVNGSWKVITDIGTEYIFPTSPTFAPADSFKVPQAEIIKWQKSVKGKSYEAKHFSFASVKAGNVPGILYTPLKTEIKGIVLLQHGLGENASKESFSQEAELLAANGYAAIMIDAPFKRKDAGYIQPGGMRDSEIILNNTLEWKQLIQMLPQMKLPKLPIVMTGHSYGARVAALLACVEPALKHVIFMGGIVNYPEWMKTTLNKEIAALREQLPPSAFDYYLNSVAPYNSSVILNTKNDLKILMQAGAQDVLISPYDYLSDYIMLNAEKELRWYSAGHELNKEAMLDRLEMIKKWTK